MIYTVDTYLNKLYENYNLAVIFFVIIRRSKTRNSISAFLNMLNLRSQISPILQSQAITVHEIGYQLLLITNRKSHTCFRLILSSMTLNNLERRNSPHFVFFFVEFDCYAGQLRHSG